MKKEKETLDKVFIRIVENLPHSSFYFSSFYEELEKILFTLVDLNLLTYHTAKSIGLILKTSMDEMHTTSHSKDSTKIKLRKYNFSDSFSIESLLRWLITELLKDPLLSRIVNGQNGIMGFLNMLSIFVYPENIFSKDIDALDLFIYKNNAYYTALDENEQINLYFHEKVLNSSIHNTPFTILYYDLNNSKIFFDASKQCICINESNTLHFCYYLRSKSITFEPHYIIGNDETSVIYFKDFLTKMPLKARELAWKSIVAQCYTFHMDVKKKFSDRLKLHEIFQPPLCLSANEIQQKMNIIEQGLLDHTITINENYYVNFLRILLLLESEKGADYDLLNELVACKYLHIRLDIEPIQDHIVSLICS